MTHKVQIDDVVRDATPEEATAIDARQADAVAQQQVLAERAASRNSALAKLADLGLTPDEISTLVGG